VSHVPVPGQNACPVCGGGGDALLRLPAQPVYQHPVPPDAVVPEPHRVDLSWSACRDCAHAWQPHFDVEQLRSIYRSHYYTPAPHGIGTQFQDEFLRALAEREALSTTRAILEIGASDGGVLAELRDRSGATHAYAFEPNAENAAVARSRGLDVRERFFGPDAGTEQLAPVNFAYARHVIEHVFDFAGFFAGLQAVTTPAATLALETPSLDHHAACGSADPFHIEHVHVFSLRSLATLARLHGWQVTGSTVTRSGNLIAVFARGAAEAAIPGAPPRLGELQGVLTRRHVRARHVFQDRRLIFWGAGSAGIALATILGREPDIWTDGNPNKVGRRFVGSTRSILSPEQALRLGSTAGEEMTLVVTSSFAAEILPRVRECGWRREVYGVSGEQLSQAF
jgi:hypothetical protein